MSLGWLEFDLKPLALYYQSRNNKNEPSRIKKMPDFKDQLKAAAAKMGLTVDPTDNTNPQTLDAQNASIVSNLRTVHGDAISAYSDNQILSTYADWSMSEDFNSPADNFLSWLTDRYNPSAEADAHDIVMAAIAEAEADGETAEDVLQEDMRREAMRDGGVLGAMSHTVRSTDQSAETGRSHPVDPLDINPEPMTLEDFTPRQHLSVLTDLLRARRSDELMQMIADLLGSVTRMQLTTETDAIVVVAENAKLTDFVLATFRLLDLAPLVMKLDRQTLMAEHVRIDFNRKTSRFSLTELETGMISAFKAIHDLQATAGTVPNLRKQLDARAADLQRVSAQLEKVLTEKEAANNRAALLEAAPKPLPVVNSEGKHFVQVRWTVNLAKEGETPNPTLFYLTLEDGAVPNSKGLFKTASFRRTKDRQKAMTFDSMDAARSVIARILKNAEHLDKKSKVTVRALNSAKVVQLMELEN
jgi:hypothetical protein